MLILALALSQLESLSGVPVPPAPAVVAKPALSSPLLGPAASDDRDKDGLSDAAERELAEIYRPNLVFDSRENATGSGEPVTIFQARPLSFKPLRVKLVYTNLWAMDGGYGPESRFCRDKHIGDDQAVIVVVLSDDGGKTFSAESADIGAYQWPKSPFTWSGVTHFELYMSAGKHHYFYDASMNGKPSPYSKWYCADSVDGKGSSALAVLSANAGEPEAHDPAYFAGDLTSVGFPGEDAWDARPFCGGLACDRKTNPTMPLANVWARDPLPRP